MMKPSDSIVDIEDPNPGLANRIADGLSSMPSSNCFIYRVPSKFRDVNPDSYEPRIVSIGPYHHGNQKLEITNTYKTWYLNSFIARAEINPKDCLRNFVEKIRGIEYLIRECYAESVDHFSSDEFVTMMILDGCFILELFCKYKEEEQYLEPKAKDRLFNTTWMIPSLRRDLVLLENQIPFDVLLCLFETYESFEQFHIHSLYELIGDFFDPILPTLRPIHLTSSPKIKHLLDLLRNSLIQPEYKKFEYLGEYPVWEYTTCATELQIAGVKFKRKDKSESLLDITFDNGIFEIPTFCFGESWTVLIPNLIVLEQCRRDYKHEITSYVILLNTLINTHDDVNLLWGEGIIDGLFRKTEKIAPLIDSLCEGVVVDFFCYDNLCNRLNAYRSKRLSQWKIQLQRNYFKTPWAIISVFAVFILVVLTVTQTLYSVLSYQRPRA